MPSENQTNSEVVLTITHEFNAPRELVFDAHSDAESLMQWWGPVGYKLTVLSLDFKPKGLFHYKMENEQRVMWARFIYGRIKRPELIEFTLSFSDETGAITRAPFFKNWPLEIFNELILTEKNGKTIITLTCYPVNATREEVASFQANKLSFHGGISATNDQLELYLVNIQRQS